MKIEFNWDEENRDLIPIAGVAVVMAIDAEHRKQLGMAYLGDPDVFTCFGLLHGAAQDARDEVENYFGMMRFGETDEEG